jgi:hypothetical protein
MWVDEEMIALNLRDRGFAGLTGALWLNQAAPLGWLWIQRLMLVEFGTVERTLRATPVFFGVATLALAWWVGRRWMGRVGASVFVLLCSFGQFIGYFPLEVKHYSADVCFGLLLPVLAVWAIEPGTGSAAPRRSRIAIWWLTAATGQWFSNGALFAAPGCAAVLFLVAWRRAGWRHAFVVAAIGLVWVASFAVHYRLSLSQAAGSEYLQSYWSEWLPPVSGGLAGALRWLAGQLEPLSVNPGGTHLWIAFWLTALCGLALAALTNVPLGLMLFSLPASSFLFAACRFVPLSGRLFLWALPALYAGIAMAADAGTGFVRASFGARDWPRVAAGMLGTMLAAWVTVDIARSGAYELSIQPRSKHNLDDRAALRYLMAVRQPGDVLMSTHMGLPAIWWYAGVNVAPPNLGRIYEPDGGIVLEARHRWPGPDCQAPDLRTALDGRPRVVLYLGFDSRTPEGFQELALDTLSELGTMVAYRRVAEEGIVAVFDLTKPPKPWSVVVTRPGGTLLKDVARARGCVGFQPARRW